MSCSVADRTNAEEMLLSRPLDRRVTRRRALALGALAGGLTLSPRFAAAVVQLDVSQGNFQPMPIGLPDFIAGTAGDGDTARGVTQIITAKICGAAACSRRSILPPTSRRSRASMPCRAFPTGAPSTRRRSLPAA